MSLAMGGAVAHLDCVFEREEDVQPLVLSQVLHVDAVVDVLQLLGTDGVRGVHLRQLAVWTLPLLGSCRLQSTPALHIPQLTL